MYGQTSFNSSKNSAAPKGLTALLLGLIVCYQVVNHIFMHQAVSHEEDGLESDAACAVGPGASLCMEAQLFKGWHEDSQLPPDTPAELDQLLVASPSAPAEQPAPTTSATPSAPPAKDPSGAEALRGDVGGPQDADPEEVKPEALEGLLWDLAWSMGGGDRAGQHEAPEKHHHKKPTPKPSAFMAKKSMRGAKEQKPKKKSFAVGLTDLQEKLEAKMQSQAQRHAEHRRIRALSVAARGHSEDSASTHHHMTSWAADLDDLTHDLQDGMKAWRKERAQHAAAHAHKQAPKEDMMTPWAHNLEDSIHEMQDHMEARDKERAAHAAAHAARLKAAHAAQPEVSPFMDEIDALGRELCQDPARRDRPACAQFMHPHHSGTHAEERKTRHDAHDNAMAHIKLLEKHLAELEKDREHDNEEIRAESTEFLKELCADPARHSYPTCAQFLASPSAAPARAGANMRGSTAAPAAAVAKEGARGAVSPPHALHWVAMTDSEEAAHSKHTQHMGASPLLMKREELRGGHWDGKIPKVAAITVLPQGEVTENLMRYFMDNYNLQHYDGERELILVYHANDKEASRIAHSFANGTSVKAAAARGETVFPSATAYRYGAWLAHDADLVVRWDFEAFHHPNRLSMQVRAIALSKRPASLVPGVTVFDGEGKVALAGGPGAAVFAGGVGNHGSLMGDAAWMREHWMPVLEVENAVLHGLHSSDVVQVAMPELLAYHDVSMLGAAA